MKDGFSQAFDQGISADALAMYRLDMLNRQLGYAVGHSRFYRDRLSGIRLPLDSVDHLSGLPFTAAEDVRDHGAEMICIGADRIERVVTLASTGSGGKPKRLYFSKADLEHSVDFFHEGMKYLCDAGDEVFIFMPAASEYSIGRLLGEGLEKLGAKPYVFGMISDVHEAAETLRRASPHTLVGTPSQMRKLLLSAPDIRVRNVLLSADYIPLSAKESISRTANCEVYEHYGLTESGYGCAVECPAHRGQHIRHDELLLEIVEPYGANPVSEGQWGEIVLTTLRREAMPLIRYRTGDLSRLVHAPCACGCKLPRLDRVLGRVSELARDINIYEMDELLLSCDSILDYHAVLSDATLTVEAEAAGQEGYDRCVKALSEKWPDLIVEVIPAAEKKTEHGAKRSINRSK